MALLFVDSFDHYATADVLEKWTTSGVGGTAAAITINATAGRRSSPGWRHALGNNATIFGYLRKVLAPSNATAIIGVAVKVVTAPLTSVQLVSFADGATTQMSVRVNSDLTLSVLRGTTVLATTSLPITANVYGYLEFKTLIDNTVGTADLRLNGASLAPFPLGSLDTQQTATAQWTSVAIGRADSSADSPGTGNIFDFDDLYVCDGSGAAPLNNFLGDCRVDARVPTAAGATTGWTPNTGANWDAVNDAAPDDDTTYTSAAAAGLTDTFTVQDAPVAGAAIYGIQHCLSVKKTDAGAATLAPVVRHSGVDYVGADFQLATAYAYVLQIAATNPGTAAAWTEAGFNAAEFGYRRTL